MFKIIGFAALAAIAALVLSFGVRGGSSTQTAHADTTDVVVIGCEFLANAVDGDATDVLTSNEVAAVCGGAAIGNVLLPVLEDGTPNTVAAGTQMYLPAVADAANPPGCASALGVGCPSIANLASEIGDEDGALEASDFRGELDEDWDDNQLSTDCHFGGGTGTFDLVVGMACTLDVFVFVNDETPVTLDLPSGLASIENGTLDYTCNQDANASVLFVPGAIAVGLGDWRDNDCSDGVSGTLGDFPNNGDGVVMFHILEDNAGAGAVLTVHVVQEAVEQTFDVNVVGSANDVKLTLVESTIEQAKSTANLTKCVGDAADTTTPGGLGIPGTSVTDLEAVISPTSTLAYAQAFDQSDTVLTRVPVFLSITPPEDVNEKAALGVGNVYEEVAGGTFFTLDPATDDAPTAAYNVVCGGKETGTTTVRAEINLISCSGTGCTILSSTDKSEQELTVGGVPASVSATATPSEIKCDGTASSTVTVKVTDSAGDNVADGVPVTFSVVALGTANPINTTTKDGEASSTITPLSNASAGVTVIITAGDSTIASPVQTSVLVNCSLPLVTQPTLAPAATPTRTGTIGGPDTGNGGYLGQGDSAGFPTWTLVALALGSMALVAGGLVARRAGK